MQGVSEPRETLSTTLLKHLMNRERDSRTPAAELAQQALSATLRPVRIGAVA